MSGYLFLALAVLCFSGLGVLHKVADFQKCAPPAINAYLFFWAGLFTTTYVFSLHASFAIPGEAAGVAGGGGSCEGFSISSLSKVLSISINLSSRPCLYNSYSDS